MKTLSATDVAIAVAASRNELRVTEHVSRFGNTYAAIADGADSLEAANARIARVGCASGDFAKMTHPTVQNMIDQASANFGKGSATEAGFSEWVSSDETLYTVSKEYGGKLIFTVGLWTYNRQTFSKMLRGAKTN